MSMEAPVNVEGSVVHSSVVVVQPPPDGQGPLSKVQAGYPKAPAANPAGNSGKLRKQFEDAAAPKNQQPVAQGASLESKDAKANSAEVSEKEAANELLARRISGIVQDVKAGAAGESDCIKRLKPIMTQLLAKASDVAVFAAVVDTVGASSMSAPAKLEVLLDFGPESGRRAPGALRRLSYAVLVSPKLNDAIKDDWFTQCGHCRSAADRYQLLDGMMDAQRTLHFSVATYAGHLMQWKMPFAIEAVKTLHRVLGPQAAQSQDRKQALMGQVFTIEDYQREFSKEVSGNKDLGKNLDSLTKDLMTRDDLSSHDKAGVLKGALALANLQTPASHDNVLHLLSLVVRLSAAQVPPSLDARDLEDIADYARHVCLPLFSPKAAQSLRDLVKA